MLVLVRVIVMLTAKERSGKMFQGFRSHRKSTTFPHRHQNKTDDDNDNDDDDDDEEKGAKNKCVGRESNPGLADVV